MGSLSAAQALLKKRGHMKADGSLTEAGKVRDGMTAKERAIDRAAKGSPSPKTSFKYNVKTNRATKKR